jgi:hypothetical protein
LQFTTPPSRRSARLALHEKGPSSPPRSLSPDLLEGIATPAPFYPQTNTAPLEAPPALEEDGVTLFQFFQGGSPAVSEECQDWCQSSIEGDSSEGGEEVDSKEGRELEEMLGWPP